MNTVVRRWRLRRQYFRAQRQVKRENQVVGRSPSPVDRAFALFTIADCEREMGEAAAGLAWGADRDADGFTLADSHRMAARAVGLVAGAELELGLCDTPGEDDAFSLDTELHTRAGETYRALRVARDPHRRAELVLTLSDELVGVLGGQAAEALVGVATCYYELAGLSLREAISRVGRCRG